MTTRHRHPTGARAPAPPRRWTVPVIAAGAVALTVASGLAIAHNDNLGDPMTLPTAAPSSSTPSRTQVPAPVFPTDLSAPAYPYGTETAAEAPAIATNEPVSVPVPSRGTVDVPSPAVRSQVNSAGSEAELTTPEPEPTQAAQPPATDHHLRIVADTNAARAELGCGPLTVSPDLDSQAQAHAEYMASVRGYPHSDGPSGYDRWAENVAQGFASDAVVQAWMDSPPHRANIADCGLGLLGIGYVEGPDGPYAVQMLAA